MIKKIGLVAIISVFALTLCSCTKSKDLAEKEKEEGVIAQYIAGSILKFDMNYEDDLCYPYQRENMDKQVTQNLMSMDIQPTKVVLQSDSTVNKEEADKEESGESNQRGDITKEQETEKPVTYSELSEVFNIKGIDVKYEDYLLVKSYSSTLSKKDFNMEANPGSKLLVVRFVLSNANKGTSKIDLIGAGITYELTEGDSSYYPTLSIVPNDIQYLSTSIKAGKKATGVLIVEVPSKFTADKAKLTITKGDVVSQVALRK